VGNGYDGKYNDNSNINFYHRTLIKLRTAIPLISDFSISKPLVRDELIDTKSQQQINKSN
jgi:hypothetical protein